MLDKGSAKKRRASKCRHFNGTANKVCLNEVTYVADEKIPCFGEENALPCTGYSPLNELELLAKEAEMQRYMDLMRQGLSSCCEALFDTSQVITSGRFKNHGPRFCSKCKRVCFMV